MPRDSSGVFTLVDGYLAVTGETIQPSQHNPPLEDIASALTGSLPRNGSAPMLAPLKMVDGSAAAPALTFNAQTGTGIFRTTNGLGIAVGGVLVAEFGAAGLLASTPVGGGMDYWGDTAPAGWIFPYGQLLSRTTYAALFAVFGTKYGAGDGSTTFGIPDKRDRASFGKGNMGGTAANRITNQSGGWEGDTLGAAGGAQTHTLTTAQIPTITPSGSVSGTSAFYAQPTLVTGSTANPQATNYAQGPFSVTSQAITASFSGTPFGGGGAHNNLPPGIVCNYIIFAGA